MGVFEQWLETMRDKHGEPVYRYFKRHVGYSRGKHWTSVGDGTTVEKDEYDLNIKESKENHKKAFWGKFKRSYVRYDRELVGGYPMKMNEVFEEFFKQFK